MPHKLIYCNFSLKFKIIEAYKEKKRSQLDTWFFLSSQLIVLYSNLHITCMYLKLCMLCTSCLPMKDLFFQEGGITKLCAAYLNTHRVAIVIETSCKATNNQRKFTHCNQVDKYIRSTTFLLCHKIRVLVGVSPRIFTQRIYFPHCYFVNPQHKVAIV